MSATQPDQPVMTDAGQIADLAKSQWFDEEEKNGAYYGWMKMIDDFDLGDTTYVNCTVAIHFIWFMMTQFLFIFCT